MLMSNDHHQLIENLDNLYNAVKGDSEDTLKTAFHTAIAEIYTLYGNSRLEERMRSDNIEKQDMLFALMFQAVFAPNAKERQEKCSGGIGVIDYTKWHLSGIQYEVKCFLKKIRKAEINQDWSHVKISFPDDNGNPVSVDYASLYSEQ